MSNTIRTINERIAQIGVVPVIKLNNPERDAVNLARALCEGGVPVAEVTFRASGADRAIRMMKDSFPDMLVGAGTVTNTEQIDEVIEAGGDFIVTPGFDAELVEYVLNKGMPIFPGCTTATDYHQALKYGLDMIKFFPAEQSGGLARIKALSAPFPQFRVMPTGGINLNNLGEYISCPVVAACGGSYMVKEELIDNRRWDEITRLCRESVSIVKEVRNIG